MKLGGWLGLALACAPAAALAQDDETAAPQTLKELVALIECRTGGPAAYNDLVIELTGDFRGETMRRLKLKKVKSDNPFLAEYAVGKSITVFGRRTNRIAFNSAGIFALLDEPDPHPLARELGATAAVDTRDRFLGEKEIRDDEQTLQDSGVTLHSRVTLNVSTVTSHPGKTLAGCGYRIEPE
jgi:hypothetical protein